MGRYFGGRFGDMHSPTATNPNTKAMLSMRDHYYMRKISGGGLLTPYTTIAEINSNASWTAIPDENEYVNTNNQGTHYNGSKYWVANGTGTVNFDNWEYPLYGKFDLRGGDATKDTFFQLYAWQGTPAQFASSSQQDTTFQMGVYWEASPNTDNLTNTLYNTGAVANGEAAYFVTSGYGSKAWAWYGGGSNQSGNSQGPNNREAEANKSWSGANLTFVCYGTNPSNPVDAGKVKMFHAETLWHTYNSSIASGRPLYMYLGSGYPNTSGNIWGNGLPKFRYGTLPAGLTLV
tara:strand:+ start:28 stop:897 length:870 start_codon:yes stop_codon:yes gene_type:complete